MRSIEYYLVGGCVRDHLLGLPAHDRDWLVVGATPQDLLQQGYRAVGQSFPVFIHPYTGEEYALARLERKTGDGHRAFSFYFSPDVTLEQDLGRRDLTINAMAEDHEGQLHDPYGGYRDLQQRILRHVSTAFSEDPLRILRVARFMSQLGAFRFNIHPSTLQIMREMVVEGALKHLSGERIWTEFRKGLSGDYARFFFEGLDSCGALGQLFPEGANCGPPVAWPKGLFGPVRDQRDTSLLNFTSWLWWLSQKSDYHVAFACLTRLTRELQLPNFYRALSQQCLMFDMELSRVQRFGSMEILEILERVRLFNRPQSWRYLVAFYKRLQCLDERFLPMHLIAFFNHPEVWSSAEKAISVRLDKQAIAGLSITEVRQFLREQRLLAYDS